MIRKSLLFSVIGVLSMVGVAAALPIVPSSDCLQNYFDSRGWALDVVDDQILGLGGHLQGLNKLATGRVQRAA